MPRLNQGETLEVRGILDLSNSESVLVRSGQWARTSFTEESLNEQVVPLTAFRVWDAQQTNLPGTAATDDLALITGTLGTDAPTIQTLDFDNTSTTAYARVQVALSDEYIAGGDVQVRIRAGMITTVADTSCTVDVQCYLLDDDGAVGADICATSAQSMNSLTKANYSFVITPTSLNPGDVLDIRIAIAGVDGTGASANIGEISKVSILRDIKG